jgi:hypothetical protein
MGQTFGQFLFARLIEDFPFIILREGFWILYSIMACLFCYLKERAQNTYAIFPDF